MALPKDDIDVRFPNRPSSPQEIAAGNEARRVASLQAVRQQEAQRTARAQSAEQAKRAGWVAEAQAQAKSAMQPKQRPLSIPEVGPPSPMQPGPSASPAGSMRETKSERLARQTKDAETTFREGKFLGMTPPNWVTDRPPSMDPNQSATSQMMEYLSRQQGLGGGQFGATPQAAPQQPGPVPQGSPSPNRPPAPMGLGDMSQGQQMPMGLGEGGKALPFQFDPQAMEQSYQATKPATPRGAEYDAAKQSLQKAAANVAADPRFSPEQRAAAFERIRSKMGELESSFAEGQDLMQSPTGFDTPPQEEFGLLQPGGLQPIGGGQLRNPETGDVLETVRGPNGEVLPVNLRQPEIDALPPGTRFLDQSGKVQVAGEAGGRRGAGGASAGGSARGGTQPTMPGTFATQEEAFAAYEKWGAKKDPGSTRGEQQVISQVLGSIADEELRSDLQAQVAAEPERAAEILQQHTQIPLAEEFENARLKEFSAEQKARGERAQRLGREMGLTPPEEKAPAVDPQRYFVETGTRGTTVIKRRGSNVAIPGVYDENGELRAAPQTAQQLMEMEPNTEFVNVQSVSGGKESRVLPFSDKMVNVGDFSLTNDQRKMFASETRQIRPRDPSEWKSFEDALSQFSAVNEPWDPDNNPAQAQLEDAVHGFYSELGPAGKAAMTMQIAHALGHRVDPTRPFKSTGWAGKKFLAGQAEQQRQSKAAAEERSPDRYMRSVVDEMLPAMERHLESGDERAFDRQATEAVKGLATALELRNPGIERGSKAFKGIAFDEIQRIVNPRTRERLLQGFGLTGFAEERKKEQEATERGWKERERRRMGAPEPTQTATPPAPQKPATAASAAQRKFLEAWRQQRGIQ